MGALIGRAVSSILSGQIEDSVKLASSLLPESAALTALLAPDAEFIDLEDLKPAEADQ